MLSLRGPQAEQRHRVTGVDRQRHPVQRVQGRRPAPFVAPVLDVVVDKHRIVQKLYRGRGGDRIRNIRPGRARHRDAQARTQHLPPTTGIVRYQLIQVRARLILREIAQHRLAGELAIFGEDIAHERLVDGPEMSVVVDKTHKDSR
jgi:hypothetical protein